MYRAWRDDREKVGDVGAFLNGSVARCSALCCFCGLDSLMRDVAMRELGGSWARR